MIKVLMHYTDNWEQLADITSDAAIKYCAKNGYVVDIKKVPEYSVYNGIEKIDQILRSLKNGDVGLVLDADALITNYDKKVEDFISEEHDLFLSEDINGINCGVMIVKMDEWARRMFHYFKYLVSNYDSIDCEQNAINKYREDNPNESHIKILAHPHRVQSLPYDFYYPDYGKWGYKQGDEIKKPTHQEGNWEKGDFICHVPGQTIEKRIEIFKSIINDL